MKYIFEVHIREGHTAEEYADAWVRASEIIQRADRYRPLGEQGGSGRYGIKA